MDELTAIENVELPALLAGRRRGRPGAAPGSCSTRSVWPTGPASCRRPCPAGSASGSRSPARWPTSRPSCWPTSRPATSTAPPRSRCCGSSTTLHAAGQTLVIVTHDARIAATADRLISMRDGAFVDETRMNGGSTGNLASLVGLDGE